MKNRFISGVVVILSGFLIALGPQFLFKVCATMEDGFPRCFWSARAEIGIGMLIAVLGITLLIFAETKVRLGLTIGVFFSSIITLCIPHALIGGCGMMTMACRRVAFPALTIIGIVLLVGSALNSFYLLSKEKNV
jgi:hypothetical protein